MQEIREADDHDIQIGVAQYLVGIGGGFRNGEFFPEIAAALCVSISAGIEHTTVAAAQCDCMLLARPTSADDTDVELFFAPPCHSSVLLRNFFSVERRRFAFRIRSFSARGR